MAWQQIPVSGPCDQGEETSSVGGGHGCRLWAEVALVLARDRLTVAGRAWLFHSDHRLATQALPDRVYTLWVPIDKMVPLLPIPTTGLLSNVRLKTCLVLLYLVEGE